MTLPQAALFTGLMVVAAVFGAAAAVVNIAANGFEERLEGVTGGSPDILRNLPGADPTEAPRT